MFYLDECWMGVNESFEYLLKIARSYKVGFTLAHQEISSFPSARTLKSIVSNCNTTIAMFPAGSEESRMLADMYGLAKKDFLGLGKYQAWVRILNQNSLVKTYPPPVPERVVTPPKFNDDSREPDTSEAREESNHTSAFYNFLRDCWFPC